MDKSGRFNLGPVAQATNRLQKGCRSQTACAGTEADVKTTTGVV